jgi:hypothetical protein
VLWRPYRVIRRAVSVSPYLRAQTSTKLSQPLMFGAKSRFPLDARGSTLSLTVLNIRYTVPVAKMRWGAAEDRKMGHEIHSTPLL